MFRPDMPIYPAHVTPYPPAPERSKQRWIISSAALYLLEQVFKMERFPSLHMRQRLAMDLGVSARQVSRRVELFAAVCP